MKNDLNKYPQLITQIGDVWQNARLEAAYTVNTLLVQVHWQIGRYIVEYEQHGNEKAEYGTALLQRLSKDLTTRFGKGFGQSNLFYIRKFYTQFPNSETLSHKLTWSHYFEILKCDDPLEISFYCKQTELEKWSVRQLKRQMQSALFQRIAISKDKAAVLELDSIDNHIFVSKYQLYLPDKQQLQNQLDKLLDSYEKS